MNPNSKHDTDLVYFSRSCIEPLKSPLSWFVCLVIENQLLRTLMNVFDGRLAVDEADWIAFRIFYRHHLTVPGCIVKLLDALAKYLHVWNFCHPARS